MHGSKVYAALAAMCLLAGCASEEERPLVPGEEVGRYDLGGGTTIVLVRQWVTGPYDSYTQRNLTWEERAVYALDGRAVVPFRREAMQVVVTEPPHTFLLEPNTTSQHDPLDGVWRRLTPAGLDPAPLPFQDVAAVTTAGGPPLYRVVGPRALALCGPALEVDRAFLRFDHVEKAEPCGGAGEYFAVHCRWDEEGRERRAITVVDGLLRPVSPPGGAVRYPGYAQGFPGQVFAWRDDAGWQLLHGGLPRLRPPARELVPGPDPRPGGYVLGFVAEWAGEDGAPVRRLLDETGTVQCDGIRAARVQTVQNRAYDGPRQDRISWERPRTRSGSYAGRVYFDWTPEYGVWLVERGDGTFEVRFPDDDWKAVATGPTAAAAMADAERTVTARVRDARDLQDHQVAAFEARLRRDREEAAREAAREEEARRRYQAALATWQAEHDAAWARARAEIEQDRQALEAWNRSWEEKGATPFYSSGTSSSGFDEAGHRARLAETEATTRALLREVERNR